MKCLIKHVVIFPKIIKLNFNILHSQTLIIESTSSLRKKNIYSFRSFHKSPTHYFLNLKIFSTLHNVKKFKLFKNLINIPISVFQFYSRRYNNNQTNFDISI